jgi:AraC-like DNA-binding protein
LIEKPEFFAGLSMDALSEALRGVRVTGAIFVNAELTAPWGYSNPPTRTVAPLVAPGTEHLILFHLVTEGRATARAGQQEVSLAPGDIVVFPHGDAHEFWNGSPTNRVDTASLLPQLLTGSLVRERGGGGGAITKLICGYFGCDRYAERFFLAGLPPLFTVNVRDDEAGRWIESALQQSLVDAVNGRAGRSAVLAKLAETLCVEALCRYMDELPPGETGWLAAAYDDVAGRVLASIHRDPARGWTLADLAREAGTSRTVLGERFTRLLGESPLAYLTRWRLQLAARQLETTNDKMLRVALDVGYESEAAFNRAFKRQFMVPPAHYRRRFREERANLTGRNADSAAA